MNYSLQSEGRKGSQETLTKPGSALDTELPGHFSNPYGFPLSSYTYYLHNLSGAHERIQY